MNEAWLDALLAYGQGIPLEEFLRQPTAYWLESQNRKRRTETTMPATPRTTPQRRRTRLRADQ
jgi:hypothetical protein